MNPSLAIQLYTTFPSCDLCNLFDKKRSDKGLINHHYSRFYHSLMYPLRNESINLFEMGIGSGGSLFAWKDYFPKANIYGADIEKSLLFEEERIKTFYCDARRDEQIQQMWNSDSLKNIDFDIIVDDGLHTYDAIDCFFRNSLQKLKVGGIFIAEDLGNNNTEEQWKKVIEDYKKEYPFLQIFFFRVQQWKTYTEDNLLIVAQKMY